MDPFEAARELRQGGVPHVFVTVVAARGSAPQDTGAKMVVGDGGLVAGTVGGGRIEAAAIETALKTLADRAPATLVTWNLQRDVGMTCGGEMTLFFDPHPGALWTIAVFGAGHITQALLPVLTPLSCRLFCFDTRREWIDRISPSPNLTARQSDDLPSLLATLPPDAFVLLMTQGHSTDLPILRSALADHSFPFLGVIGSKSKRATLDRELREAGIPGERIASYQCPLGLPIGTNHPHEIAISIAGGILQARDRSDNS